MTNVRARILAAIDARGGVFDTADGPIVNVAVAREVLIDYAEAVAAGLVERFGPSVASDAEDLVRDVGERIAESAGSHLKMDVRYLRKGRSAF